MSQIVEIYGYAYRWRGSEPLAIGDTVMLPPNWVSEARHGKGPWPGRVTAIGSTYQGSLAEVIKKVA